MTKRAGRSADNDPGISALIKLKSTRDLFSW